MKRKLRKLLEDKAFADRRTLYTSNSIVKILKVDVNKEPDNFPLLTALQVGFQPLQESSLESTKAAKTGGFRLFCPPGSSGYSWNGLVVVFLQIDGTPRREDLFS